MHSDSETETNSFYKYDNDITEESSIIEAVSNILNFPCKIGMDCNQCVFTDGNNACIELILKIHCKEDINLLEVEDAMSNLNFKNKKYKYYANRVMDLIERHNKLCKEGKDTWFVELINDFNEDDVIRYEIKSNSKDHVVEQGNRLCKRKGYTIYKVGKIDKFKPHIDAYEILYNLNKQACKETKSEYDARDYLFGVEKEQCEDLENRLNEVLAQWLKENNLECKLDKVTEEECLPCRMSWLEEFHDKLFT